MSDKIADNIRIRQRFDPDGENGGYSCDTVKETHKIDWVGSGEAIGEYVEKMREIRQRKIIPPIPSIPSMPAPTYAETYGCKPGDEIELYDGFEFITYVIGEDGEPHLKKEEDNADH